MKKVFLFIALNVVLMLVLSGCLNITPPKPQIPSPPSNLKIITYTFNSITLSWTSNSSSDSKFEIWRSTNGSNFSKIATTSLNTYIDTNLSPNSVYSYKVRAYNDGGYSNYSNVISQKTKNILPVAPSNLHIISHSTDTISLSWIDNSNSEDGFKIYRSTSYSGNYSLVGTNIYNDNYYTDTGLKSNTTYYYKVTAYNSAGESNYSNIVSGTTSAPSYAHAKILQTNSYVDSIGYLHVIGVVQNDGTENLKYVEIDATFYDKNNNVVGSDFTFAYMDILTPQQTSPFDIFISKPANYDHYKLSLSYNETKDEPFSGLKIQGVTHHTDNYGYYYIDGEVKNSNTTKAKYVELIATLYDSTGKIIYAGFTFTNSDIPVGQTSSFEFMINTSNLPGSISDFRLQVQAQ